MVACYLITHLAPLAMYEISVEFVVPVMEEEYLVLMERDVNLAPQIKCLIFKKPRVNIAPLAR